jgi:hypothetical protein
VDLPAFGLTLSALTALLGDNATRGFGFNRAADKGYFEIIISLLTRLYSNQLHPHPLEN